MNRDDLDILYFEPEGLDGPDGEEGDAAGDQKIKN